MSTHVFTANGDGSTTGWTRSPASDTFASKVQPIAGADADTTYILSPNVASGTIWLELTAPPGDFDPDAINSITIRVQHRRVNVPNMAVDLGTITARLVRSDEVTAISTTPTPVDTPIQAGYAQTNFTPSPTGTHAVSDWDGARLEIAFAHSNNQTVDTTNEMRVTAAEVEVDYTPAATGLPAWLPKWRLFNRRKRFLMSVAA